MTWTMSAMASERKNDATREVAERPSFRAALASMPDVGTDEDFEFENDLPRRSKPA